MYFVNENIRDLYRVKCLADRSNVIRLDMNENPIGLPKEFVERVKAKITPELIATYPMKEELIDIIAEHNSILHDSITVTAGSEEAIRLIFQCFGQEGSSLLTVVPTFEMYDVYSKMFGMKHDTVEYDENFSVKADDVLEKINQNTGIVILLNPNSPIGTTYTDEDFEKIINKANEMNAIVVIDEAYHYFYKNTQIKLIDKYKNVIVLRTFSKLFSAAGLRVGYAAASSELISYIEKAQSTYNVSTISILFAIELLKDKEVMNNLIKIEREGRAWISEQLEGAGYKVISKEGNYVLFYPNIPSSELVSKLKEKGIWVRDYNNGVLKGWVRVSTGEVAVMKQVWEKIQLMDKM